MHVQGDMATEEIRQPAKDFKRRNSLVLESFPWFHGRMVASGKHLRHHHLLARILLSAIWVGQFAIDNGGCYSFVSLPTLIFPSSCRTRNAHARPSPATRLSGMIGTQSREEYKRSNLTTDLPSHSTQPQVARQGRGIQKRGC